jgi:hypothetical protein
MFLYVKAHRHHRPTAEQLEKLALWVNWQTPSADVSAARVDHEDEYRTYLDQYAAERNED